METIFNDNFQKIEFDSASSLLKVQWMNTEKLKNESYKNELLEQIKIIELFKPKRVLIDSSTFTFVINIQIQEWNKDHILKRAVQAGVRLVATLIAPDLIAQVAIEQNMEEEPTSTLVTKYFENEQDAIEWLKEN